MFGEDFEKALTYPWMQDQGGSPVRMNTEKKVSESPGKPLTIAG